MTARLLLQPAHVVLVHERAQVLKNRAKYCPVVYNTSFVSFSPGYMRMMIIGQHSPTK